LKLEGVWWNELGSMMKIEVDPEHPKTIHGHYHTNVGSAQEKRYPLLGRCDNRGLQCQMVAFVVAWNTDPPAGGEKSVAPSVTAWSGQLQDVNGEEVITTTWLLDRLTDPSDDWESTLVGMDYFTRRRPSQEQIEARNKHGRAARALR
jgi:Avidin family